MLLPYARGIPLLDRYAMKLKLLNNIFQADEIYHLASPASPPHYMENPVKTIKTNTLGTINMLGMC